MMRNRQGLSLIDLLISMAMFAIVSVSFIVVFIAIVNVQTRQSSQSDVTQQSQTLLEQLQYYIESARLADMTLDTPASAITLRMANPAIDPTVITLASGTLYVQQGFGSVLPLTTSRVTISSTSFTRHYNLGSSSGYGTDSVSFSFVMAANTSNTKQSYSKTFETSATVLAPVPKLAMLQQSSTASNNPSVSSLSTVFGTANETSSLLIAVTANTTSTATVNINDTAGNTWNLVTSVKYPAYNEELNVFAAYNARNASNTVTASFGAGAGYASLFTYEYRGAATAASADVSSTQLQASNAMPSSGSVTPSSPVELLFGASYDGSTNDVPSAATGYTLETSSTVTHVFVEDMDQYITGAVAATWQYPESVSSSELIVTFR